MPEARTDLPQGTLDLLILKVLTLGPLHGYAIAQRLQQISRDVVQVQQGSLYPALHRLENGAARLRLEDSDTARGEVLTGHGEGGPPAPSRESWRHYRGRLVDPGLGRDPS